MRRVAIVGAGGINSWVVKHLNETLEMFGLTGEVYVKIFDNDKVEEKNLLRSVQNFEVSDLMMYKAEMLSRRYEFDFENVFITEENLNILDNFDDIILGVDNNKVRRLLYDYCLKNGQYLLDLRAQGTQMSFYVLDKSKDMEYYDNWLFKNKEVMERKGSCQYTHDILNDHVENGNKIIAFMGVYGVYLKHIREEELSTKEWEFVY